MQQPLARRVVRTPICGVRVFHRRRHPFRLRRRAASERHCEPSHHQRREKTARRLRCPHLLESSPEVRELARDPRIRNYAAALLGEGVFAVRAVFFDKVPGANWSLFWHQDNVIVVNRRIESPDFTGWSNKAGVWQVQPPVEMLGRMVAIRLHLDD